MSAFDIETYHEKKKNRFVPYCVVYSIKGKIYNQYYSEFENMIIKSIDDIYSKISNEIIIYIHNLNFDGLIIINELSQNTDITINSLIVKMNIYSITLTKKNKKIIFKCSYKLLPESLKKISAIFEECDKMLFPYEFASKENLNYVGEIPDSCYFKSPKDYEDFKKNNSSFNFKEYSIEYCTRDVIITSNFIKKIKNIAGEYGVNIDKTYSAPSLSFKIFEKNFNNGKLSFSLSTFWENIIRTSYFGGRCEVYGNPYEDEIVHYYDFSGMYGQCMMEKFPYGDIRMIKNPLNIDTPGFYYIVYNGELSIPVLPHKNKITGKLMFANGTDEGLFWFEEILLFKENGGILLDIKYAILYEKFDFIFDDFVKNFENLKKKDEIHKKFAKLIINSLYGRMGMNNMEEESLIIKKNDFRIYEKKYRIKSFVELNEIILINIENTIKKKLKKNISIASCITSKARIKLYKAQMDVVKNNGRLLYSDTDSIYASFKEDVSKKKHGIIEWNKEKLKIIDAVFISPKTYAYMDSDQEVVKIKGFNNKSIKYADLKKSFYNNENYLDIHDEFKLKKKDMFLEKSLGSRKLSLCSYDKRFFDIKKKETYPYKKINDFVYEISHPIESKN